MKQFDADKKAEEGSLEVIIGGQSFIAKEPTLAVMKELAEAAPGSTPEEEEGKSESERMTEGIESIYPQLEVLLSAKENFEYDKVVMEEGEPVLDSKGKKKTKKEKVAAGDPPPKEFVEKHLSMRRAGEMIQTLMGEDESNPH